MGRTIAIGPGGVKRFQISLAASYASTKDLDGTKRLRYIQATCAGKGTLYRRREPMRTLMSLLIALVLLLGAAGAALAECGAGHTDTAKPTPTKPLPQS